MSNELEQKKPNEIGRPIARGHEEAVAQEDLIIPRVKLLQALSPEVQEDPKTYQQGLLINSLTKEILAVDPDGWISFVPVLRSVNWVRFNARNDKDPNFDPAYELGQVIWRTNDPKDPRVIAEGKFGEDGTPPKATKFINYLVCIPGVDMPLLLSFAKTSFKAGKTLSTFTEAVHMNDDTFRWRYKVRTKKEQNDAKQQYFVLEVAQAGKSSDDDFQIAEAFYENFKGRELKVDEEHIDDIDVKNAKEEKPWDKQ